MNPPIIDVDFYMQASFNQYCAYTAWLRYYWRTVKDAEYKRLERASWMHLFIHEERISL